jgi:AcrR family transcriptional regulator
MNMLSEDAVPDHHRTRRSLRATKKRETAERIYQAALRLFRERGYAATTVDDIAQAAHVAKGTFFNYFATKDAVLAHLGERQMEMLERTLAATSGFAEQSAAEQLTFVFNTLAAGVEDEHEIMRVVALETFRHAAAFSDISSSARRLFDLLAGIVRRGQERGELRASAPAESLTLIVLATYLYTFLAWVETADAVPFASWLHLHLDLLLEGMRSR